jgi:glycosyltransferase involved in cell wall biosynthesis
VYYDCARYLPQAGIELKGLVIGSSKVAIDSHGSVVAVAPTKAALWQRWRGFQQSMQQTLTEFDCDLVTSHFALYGFPVLPQLGKLPLVTHFQGPWALESKAEGAGKLSVGLKWMVEKLVYDRSNGFIVLSEAFRQILHKTYGVPLERIHVIPSGIDCQQFNCDLSSQQARDRLGWPQDRRIILSVRRLVHRVGLENLITAIAEVKQAYPDALLLIAGKGAIAAQLQAQIESLGLQDCVRLLGFVADQDLPIAYRAANFSIIPTVALEGFGLTVVESLATGTPVIGTPIGGIPEILLPLSSQLVLEGYEPSQLARGLVEVLAGQRSLPSRAECQAYARTNYDWPAVANRITSVYAKVLKGKG